MKVNNRKELQNIVISTSADIDYQDFMKIYRECTKKPYNLMTTDTTLLASGPLRFRKKLFHSYKNEVQYDLDRKAAKISALSSNNLGKYEYLTGEDLRLKPSTVE